MSSTSIAKFAQAEADCTALTNETFMEVMGRGMDANHCQRVASFPDDPKQPGPGKWLAKPYRGQVLDPANNNYFTLCEDNGEGRAEDHFVALRVLALDDIGTKAQVPPSAPVPTCVVETSPENCQVFYHLDPPETRKDMVRRAFLWLVHLGMTDPGTSPMGRLMRAPVGRNRKKEHGPEGFIQRTKAWNEGASYELVALMTSLGADMTQDPPKNAMKATKLSVPKKSAPMIDEAMLAKLRSQRNTRLLMQGDGHGADKNGSEGDMKLAICIGYLTQDRDQFMRIYGATERAQRRSSDGTQKWLTVSDYHRNRLYEGAMAWVEDTAVQDRRV